MFSRITTRTINPELFRMARAETEVSGRLDHHIADKHSLLLKYAFTNNREAGDAFNRGGLVDPSARGSNFIEDQGVTGSVTSVLGSYTFSKTIDDASDFNEQPQNPYLLPAERALSANDQRHRFVFSGTFDLPFGEEEDGKRASGVIAKLFGNIETAPILTIGSSRPINPLTGFDANRSGALPLSSRPIGFGRNSVRTGTQAQLDLRVLKFFKVGEHGKLDFVVESFNILNHTNVVALNQSYGVESSSLPGFGTPNKASIPRQFQCSLDFEF